jgi:hypothetical protein
MYPKRLSAVLETVVTVSKSLYAGRLYVFYTHSSGRLIWPASIVGNWGQ